MEQSTYKFVKYKRINDLRDVWVNIYNQNKDNCPMLNFGFVKAWNSSLKNFVRKIVRFLKNKGWFEYYLFYKNDVPVMILPLLRNKKDFESQYLLDYFDVICLSTVSKDDIENMISNFCIKKDTKIIFYKINASSKLYSVYSKKINMNKLEDSVKIEFPTDFEQYKMSLSKNTRQNIRTAYNRLVSDAVNFEFIPMHQGEINKQKKILTKLYLKRASNRYEKISFVSRFCKTIKEPVLFSMVKSNELFGFKVVCNGEVAAYMVGFLKDNIYIVPRLSVNENFKKYSCGILLINETIKYFIEKTPIKTLDLALGTENYKFVMGGQIHNNYEFAINK